MDIVSSLHRGRAEPSTVSANSLEHKIKGYGPFVTTAFIGSLHKPIIGLLSEKKTSDAVRCRSLGYC
jgi:hypothetical protein